MKKTALLFVLAMLWSDYATAQTPYFQGKTIRIIVGYPAGSAHDLWGRLIATQLNKHIPGSPATVVQNMPGAGSMTATNYVYNVAKPDGQTIVVNNAALYFEQLLKKERSPIRLVEIHLGWQHDSHLCVAVHVGRRSL